MSTQFIIDENGRKVAAVIPIEEYAELMEDLEDIASVAERRDEESVPLETILKEFKKNGLVSS